MTIYEALQSTGLPCVFSHFDTPQKPPYIAYIGNGQTNFEADDTYYFSYDRYQVEYYFTKKNAANEAAIERSLLESGFRYEKSEDLYLEDQGVFVIYYQV